MRYANPDDVLRHLELSAPGDDVQIAEVERVENALADVFDDAIGRTFGIAAVAETRETVLPQATSRLIAATGIRTVTAIETGGTWDGSAWQDGDTVPATDYRLTLLDHSGLYWGIDRLNGGWSGTVRVTATWGDQPEVLVPDDVSAALTFLTVRQMRRLTSSPQELVGPDGFAIPTPHGWDDPLVKKAIDRHTVKRLVL